MKKLILIAVVSSILSGCATVPPKPKTPVNLLTESQICQEVGVTQVNGDADRLAQLLAEGQRRDDLGQWSTDMAVCKMLGNTAANGYQQQRQADAIEGARQQAAWAAVGQMGQQMQQQAAYDQQQQMQQALQQQRDLQQQMQMQQLNQNLRNINNSLNGNGF